MASSPPEREPPARERLLRRLAEPVDIASLVYFRIAFGLIMLWQVGVYVLSPRIRMLYLDPDFLFKYHGFEWVQPWPGDMLYLHFWGMGLLALFITVGFLYRISVFLFFLAFSYVFLLEQAKYLNHYYFVILVSFTMIFAPAHRAFSIDAWMRGAAWRRTTQPTWALFCLRVQMGFVYFFAGVAKLDPDWLRGYPMREWMAREGPGVPAVGQLLALPEVATLMAWGGMLLDLFIVPALLWRRTRWLALGFAVFFHVTNKLTFNIGIFPWFSLAATLLFFDPSWPRRLLRRPALRMEEELARFHFGRRERAAAWLAVVYVAIQTVIPLRPHLYPGRASWNEEGHRFSWRQKLRDKEGFVRFLLTDPSTGDSWTVDPRPMLTKRQYRKMVTRPYMILQFAQHLSELASEEGKPPVQVRAASMVGLNGREMQPYIDGSVDLAAQPRRFLTPHPWVLPLEVPLEAQWDGESPPKHPATLAAIEANRQRFLALKETLPGATGTALPDVAAGRDDD